MRILENKFIIVSLISILMLIIIVLSGLSWYLYNRESQCNIEPLALSSKDTEINSEDDEASKSFYVEIKGAVVNPGVYEAQDGEIINDVINKAGGLNDNAYTDNINLSKKLEDELVIYIYTVDEMQENTEEETNPACKTESYTINTCTEGKVSIISSNDSNVYTENEKSLININTAGVTELMELSGIGETKANNIITYRQENGNYKSIDDLKNVSGIGDATFEKLKDYITV